MSSSNLLWYWQINHTALTAKSYIQDGLIAMWDGIENAGWGVHDGNATSWVDLVSGREATRYNENKQPVWGDNCWTSTSATEAQAFDTNLPDAVVGRNTLTFETLTMRKSTDRGIICGQYSLANYPGINLENFSSQQFRVYWNGNPDIYAKYYPINVIKYFATSRNGNICNILDETGAVLATQSGTSLIGGTKFRIGADIRVNIMCFYGNIYAIRIYSRVLTSAEIAHNYMIDKTRFNIA